MSAEEDTELRDLVAQTLESNGVLGKIRVGQNRILRFAQLRASVFLALEEQESVKNKSPFLNKDLKDFINTREGRVVTCLVREFLDFFNLDYTKSVFDPETGSSEYYEGRNALSRDLDIIESSTTSTQPLLSEVVKRCSSGFGTGRHTHESGAVFHYDMSPEYLEAARLKFEEYDEDNSGSIDKDELRELFCDVFPDINRAMLDRYVNDEFKVYDKDFSNSIDFEEFLDMYKRLFILHKSSVSEDIDEIVHSPRRQHHSPHTPPPPLVMSPPPPPLPHSPPPTLSPTSRKNQPTMGSSLVESMNKKNITDSQSHSGIDGANSLTNHQNGGESRGGGHVDSPRDTFINSDNDDSFFDDKLPQNDRIGVTSKDTHQQANRDNKTPTGSFEYEESPRPKTPDTDRSGKDLDKKMSELGISVPDEEPDDQDYEEDFDSSKMSSVNKTGGTGGPQSGMRTPRSARSDSTIQSIEEDFDIEEDELSGANDLLKSDPSQKDDMTTDRTVSPHDQSEAFDYVEEIAP